MTTKVALTKIKKNKKNKSKKLKIITKPDLSINWAIFATMVAMYFYGRFESSFSKNFKTD